MYSLVFARNIDRCGEKKVIIFWQKFSNLASEAMFENCSWYITWYCQKHNWVWEEESYDFSDLAPHWLPDSQTIKCHILKYLLIYLFVLVRHTDVEKLWFSHRILKLGLWLADSCLAANQNQVSKFLLNNLDFTTYLEGILYLVLATNIDGIWGKESHNFFSLQFRDNHYFWINSTKSFLFCFELNQWSKWFVNVDGPIAMQAMRHCRQSWVTLHFT